jgi:DeoR family transcriptional regulator, suf operon transcriptional repressor
LFLADSHLALRNGYTAVRMEVESKTTTLLFNVSSFYAKLTTTMLLKSNFQRNFWNVRERLAEKMATTHQSSTKQDILEYLLKHSQATAFELAEVLDVSPQAIRRHLKDLEAEELVLYSSVQAQKTQSADLQPRRPEDGESALQRVVGTSSGNLNFRESFPHQTTANLKGLPQASEIRGMGRPQHIYHLSRQGRDRLQRTMNDRQSDRYGEFAVSLLDTLAETVGRDQVSSILRKQWERKAQEYYDRLGNGSLQERVANLVKLRKAEGFMAEYHSVDADSSPNESSENKLCDRFILTEHHCAISNVAESFPSICGHELEMFAAVLPDCTVERTHWIINGEHRCGYLVQARKQKCNE